METAELITITCQLPGRPIAKSQANMPVWNDQIVIIILFL